MLLVFDIGGTKTRVGIAREEEIGKTEVLPTSPTFESGVRSIAEAAHRVSGGEKFTRAVGAVRGVLSADKSSIESDAPLGGWARKPLKKSIEEALGAEVFLENDAALAALGEATRGAGRGKAIVAYLTISTGVGGARVVNGGIDEKSIGFEPGKQIIDPDNTLCPECSGNTLEDYVSGAAVEKRFGRPAKKITDERAWEELAGFLAYGIHNILVHWSPDVVVLGGSMILGTPSISVPRVVERLAKIAKEYPVPPVVKGELGDSAGLIGAVVYAQQLATRV